MGSVATEQSFPERVGRYELLVPIGTGGMATVYLAASHGAGGFQREVALKLAHAHLRADDNSKLHFLEEARLAARIHHPNVVPVLEVDEDPHGVFLVMEYAEGTTLSGLLSLAHAAGRALEPPVLARILDDALSGLHAAHELTDEHGESLHVVHRDFSPQNILVDTEGVARLTDFGIAKASSRALRTKTGLVKGKVSYMAPEQARGRDIDRRCDVWAAGVVAWEMIAGQRLYDQDDDVSMLLEIVTGEPRRLSSVVPDVSPELDSAVASALETELEERCPTAEELRRRLAAAWAGSGGIADRKTVARVVREIVGDELAAQRRRIQEIRKHRSETENAIPVAAADADDSQRNSAIMEKGAFTASPDDVSSEQGGSESAAASEPSEITLRAIPFKRRPIVPIALGAMLVAGMAVWIALANTPPPKARSVEPIPAPVVAQKQTPAATPPAKSAEPETAASTSGEVSGKTEPQHVASHASSAKQVPPPKRPSHTSRRPTTLRTPGAAPPSGLAKDPYK